MRVLAKLEKGHTRADFERVVELCRDAGSGARADLRCRSHRGRRSTAISICSATIDRLDLVEHVAPIQLAIRLLDSAGLAHAGACGDRARRRALRSAVADATAGRIRTRASTRCRLISTQLVGVEAVADARRETFAQGLGSRARAAGIAVAPSPSQCLRATARSRI